MAHDTPVIIVFDSGLGGVTILRKILQRGINCDLIYVADNLFVPYGSKSKDFIEEEFTLFFWSLIKNILSMELLLPVIQLLHVPQIN